MSWLRRPAALAGALLAVSVGLAGCSFEQSQPGSADATAQLAARVSDTVTAKGVLLAAVLLSTADIESAVAEGLVTPDEIDEAKHAIEHDTLDAWRELAEQTAAK